MSALTTRESHQVYLQPAYMQRFPRLEIDDHQDLPHLAYETRTQTKEKREAFALRVVSSILFDTASSQERACQAQALHIVATTLASDLPPAQLIDLLKPAIAQLSDHIRDAPDVACFHALLVRTISMASSKLDRYTGAFYQMHLAQTALNNNHPAGQSRQLRLEARQQLYLQECGQLIRHVEAGLVESNPAKRKLHLLGHPPTSTIHKRLELGPMRVLARAGAEAGRRSCVLLERLQRQRDLAATPDPDEGTLATTSWLTTARIMHLRAVLLSTLVEMLCGVEHPDRLNDVPVLYANIVETDGSKAELPSLTVTNRMDLTRNVLLWSFLGDTSIPYRRPTRGLRTLRRDVPNYLVEPVDGRLNTVACSDALAAEGHNAGILDNLGRREPFTLLGERSGSAPSNNYSSWLDLRRGRQRARMTIDPMAAPEVRTSQQAAHLARAAGMVIRCGRYDESVFLG